MTASDSPDGLSGTSADPGPEDEEPGSSYEIRYLDLVRRGRQVSLPPPMAQEPLLPLNRLDPEIFERLVAEYVWRLPDTRRIRLYGRRGQADYGLDAVAVTWSGDVTVYQAKRYQQLTPAKIRAAVREYAGVRIPPGAAELPRRFAASRFVLVTSAPLETGTANVDEAERLISEYEGDIGIDVIGAEQLSRVLHDSVSVVSSIFGPDWARVFCGSAPPPAPARDPAAYGLLEGPLALLDLEEADRASREAAPGEPARSAALDSEIAAALEEAGFPGHARFVRRRAAATLLEAGQVADGFAALYKVALSGLLAGTPLEPGLHYQMLTLAGQGQLQGADQARNALLLAIHNWAGTGSSLAAAVPALAQLHAAQDPDAGILMCTVFEHALIDGIYEYEPPRSAVADCPPETADLARQVLVLAGQVTMQDKVWQARIRCAAADAELDLARAAGHAPQPSSAYAQLVSDATAGRYPPGAASLILSRAARAHAVNGEGTLAIDRWRRSIMEACQTRLYGDVRDLFRAIHHVAIETDLAQLPDLSQVAEGLPNQKRLLAGAGDPALVAFEASHNGNLPDAYEDARRCLRQARLAGHLREELLYLRLFGDVLASSDEPTAAVEALAAAGEGDKAADLAEHLSDLADLGDLLSRPFGRQAAAAARVTGAQAQLIPDRQVAGTVAALLDVAEKPWGGAPGWGADPARQALEAVCRLGVRIPGSLADRVLDIISPALTAPSGHTGTAIAILVNMYHALPDQRADLAPRITALLGQPAAQPYIWGLLAGLREDREHLQPAVEQHASTGSEQALRLLAAWGTAGPEVQLAARRAAAVLLRRETGIQRQSFSSGMWNRGAELLAAVLQADGPLSAIDPAELEDPAAESGPGQPDDAAVLAAGDLGQLAVACACKLAAIASDGLDAITSRHHAVAALRTLLPHLPADTCASLTGNLARLHASPGLSQQDMWDLQSLRPLSRGRTDSGARTFSAAVLLAAAEACAQAGTRGAPTDEPLAREITDAAVNLVRSDDPDVAEPGARALAVAARSAGDAAISPILLAAHPEECVRRHAVALWLAAGTPPGIIGRLVRDESPGVRASVARDAEQTAAAAPAEAGVIRALADDPHYAVRHAYAHRRGTA